MTLSQLFSHYGYVVLLLGSLFDGLPVMLFGGFAAHRGWLTLAPHVILAGTVGNFLAWVVWFSGARAVGERLLEKRPRWAKAVEGIGPKLQRWEAPTVVLARFVPGLDTPAILALALSSIPVPRFLAWNAVGALLWAVTFGLLGYALGPAVQNPARRRRALRGACRRAAAGRRRPLDRLLPVAALARSRCGRPAAGDGGPAVTTGDHVDPERATPVWRRPVLLHQAPYVLLVVLAFAGVAYNSLDPVAGFRYAQFLPVLFGLVIVAASWRRATGPAVPHGRLVVRQGLHWLAVLVAIEILRVPIIGADIGDLGRALIALHVLATGTVLAGIYADPRLVVVGAGMWAGLLGVALLENWALAIVLIGLLTLAAVLLAHRLLRHRPVENM